MMSPHGTAAATQVSFHARAEDLLCALRGVTEVSIDGVVDCRVTELRVISTEEMSRRQVERNLASALMAGFGIELDAGAIRFVEVIDRSGRPAVPRAVESVPVAAKAQSSRPKTRASNPRFAERRETKHRASRVTRFHARMHVAKAESVVVEAEAPVVPQNFVLVDVRQVELADGRFRYTVVLDARGGRCVGEVEGAGSELSRIECAARAVVEASRSVLNGRLWYVLDGVRLVELMGRSYVLSAVRTSDGEAVVTSAAAAVETTFEHASAEATVAALNS